MRARALGLACDIEQKNDKEKKKKKKKVAGLFEQRVCAPNSPLQRAERGGDREDSSPLALNILIFSIRFDRRPRLTDEITVIYI